MKYLVFLLFCLSCSKKEIIEKETFETKEVLTECQLLQNQIKKEEYKITIQDSYLNNLFYAKSNPVIFPREPYFISSDEKIIKLRNAIDKEVNPWDLISKLKYLKPAKLRELLLKEGYLYSSNKNESYALTQLLKIEDLFDEEEVYLTRGSDDFVLIKSKSGYLFKDGPLAGQRATLLLYDRLTPKKETPIHIDLQFLRNNFEYNQIKSIFKNNNFIYLEVDDKEIILKNKDIICGELQKKEIGIISLKSSMLSMVEDKLPFDEPMHEYGEQLDGALRPRWEKAFYNKEKFYFHNGDKYNVFSNGKPYIPQVCVDFIFDTVDRASGTWYSVSGRTVGNFNSKNYSKDYNIRSVSGFIKFAEDNENLFQVINFKSEKFKSKLFYKNLPFKTGDIVFVKGYTPWDKKEEHFHSFFIFETDPIYNIPFLLAGNAGPASLRVWEVERKRTPERFVFKVVRPKKELISLFNKTKKESIIIK